MSLRPLLPAILLALVMSVVVGVLATGRDSGPTLALAVGLFVVQILFAMVRVDAPYWRARTSDSEDLSAVTFVWRNAVLAALVYTWGATAMLAIYSMSVLVWRHWWQYGAGMALFAAIILLYAYLLAAGRARLSHSACARDPDGPDGVAGDRRVRGAVLYLYVGKAAHPARRLGGKLYLHRRKLGARA